MPDRPVIVNNTPLVALWTLGRLDILRELYGEVLIPSAVLAEFLATESATRQASLQEASWIQPASLADQRHASAYIGLDQGEAEVLALAEERLARLVIIDERKGRRYARRLELTVTGTLGVLLLAKEQGLITSLAPVIAELQQAGLFLSSSVITEALRLAGESG